MSRLARTIYRPAGGFRNDLDQVRAGLAGVVSAIVREPSDSRRAGRSLRLRQRALEGKEDDMLKRGFKDFLAEANAVVESVAVMDLAYHLEDEDVVLLDVREAEEREQDGEIPGSIHVPRGFLEFQADPESPIYNSALDPERRIIVYCGTGGRSALAAKTLLDMGFREVASLAGGYASWRKAQAS
jgi:rhodanese-related sulfurtransferase